jgi:subtilisin family serine protease
VNVLIGFTSAPGLAYQSLVRTAGGQIKYVFDVIPAIAANLPQQAIAALQNNPRIAVIEPDGQVAALDAELDAAWGVKHIGAGVVHGGGVTGAGVKVAVIDSGMDLNHPDLPALAGGWNFVQGGSVPYDENGHGTHVAGTVAARDNGVGVVGVAPGVQLYVYKVLNASGSGAWSDIIAALQQAMADGVQVTNNSYGSSGDPGTLVLQAFDNSAAAGILHIASAGNSGNCSGRNDSVGYPARYASVVAVAATDSTDARACFSSTGPDVEVAAPGVFIASTVPDDAYGAKSGTSMASPHVAGLAALVMDAGVTAPASVRNILGSTAVDLGAKGRDNHYGFGRVDAIAAVAAAEGTVPDPDPDPDPEPGVLTVASIAYATSGGRTNDKHLAVTVTIVDGSSAPASGVSVAVTVYRDGSPYGSGSGTTAANGQALFEIKNAPAGTYTTDVTTVNGAPYAGEPDPGFIK